ncbi:MAG: hypothetical protein EB073_07775, partial [Burkholderiaceae bacterium]|nr:hypothetical protein [Burkholderiaceae bacterium]
MAALLKTIINTRKDLDSIKDTPEHAQFIDFLRGSMVHRQNVAVYPEGYGETGYDGPVIEPIWEDVEDLSTIER